VSLPILKDTDPRLRIKSEPVNDDVTFIADEMFKTLAEHPHGIALAAPQVGVHLRLFVIKKSYAKKMNISYAIVNPTWAPAAPKTPMEEGCLSFENVRETKSRHPKIKVTFEDLNGKKYTKLIADPLLSQIFQHEIEHLDGILMTDK